MIETESGGFALVHVDAVHAEAPLSFEEARAQAEAEVIAARRLDALEAQAAEAVAALNGGADLAETAAGLGAEVETLDPSAAPAASAR